ncbi:MAG: hypothetical protein CMH81_06130 [Nitrospiraceae bacterium]|nr:hypothetical protein [Nitrospiraceae bacterium]
MSRFVCIGFAMALVLSACGDSSEHGAEITASSITGSGDNGSVVDNGGDVFEVMVVELTDGSYVCSPSGQGLFPGVLYNHGGLGTAIGGDLKGTCQALAEAGFLARSEKRPETVPLVGHLDEVLAGLDMLRSHAKIDPSRVGIMGFSRGGLLTLQAAIARPNDVHAILILAPASGRGGLRQALENALPISAPLSIHVSENDLLRANHVQLSRDVENALREIGKDVELTIYPPFGEDGHRLFFEVRDPYWSDVIAFLDTTIGSL